MPFLLTTKRYDKQLKKFRVKHPELREAYANTILILEKDPYQPSLKLHNLKGKLSKYQAVSINFQYRIVIELIMKENKIILLNIGSHDQLYK